MVKYKDTIAGAASIVISVVLFIATFSIREFTRTSLGADFVPRLAALVLCLLGVVLIVKDYRARRNAPTSGEPKPAAPAAPAEGLTGPLPVLLNIGLFVVYLLLLERIGFVILTPIYMFFQILLLTNPRKFRLGWFAVLSIVVSAGAFYLFVNFFQVLLPNGVLE